VVQLIKIRHDVISTIHQEIGYHLFNGSSVPNLLYKNAKQHIEYTVFSSITEKGGWEKV